MPKFKKENNIKQIPMFIADLEWSWSNL